MWSPDTRVLRIIPNKFIQSHLSVTVLASAISSFLVLHYTCGVPLNTPSLEQLCFLGLIHLLKHAENGHGLFLCFNPEMVYNMICAAL